jgi:hypothetical protein
MIKIFLSVAILTVVATGCTFNRRPEPADSLVSIVNNTGQTIDIPANVAGTQKNLSIKPGQGWDGKAYFDVSRSEYSWTIKSKQGEILLIPH